MDTFTITVNEEAKQVSRGETVAALLDRLALRRSGIAVALNAEVVPAGEWERTALSADDTLIIITATQGG